MGKIIMGTETSCDGEAAVVERLRAIWHHVGEEGEERFGQEISVEGEESMSG